MSGRCRACGTSLRTTFANLGMSPLANSFVRPDRANEPEQFYPLHAFVCDHCFLVQLEEFATPQSIFSDYAYFSSFSSGWLEHCDRFADQMMARLQLRPDARIIEIASNDGALLKFFRDRGLNTLGIEPAANVAKVAIERGVPTDVAFFGLECARRVAASGKADLIVANNVLAHVPDINDFMAGLKVLLAPSGTATIEFPHLLQLIDQCQFDTIYHEHFSYISLIAIEAALALHDLAVYDVETLPTHGGSLRLYVGHRHTHAPGAGLALVTRAEQAAGLDRLDTYTSFGNKIAAAKYGILDFLVNAKRAGKRVAGYGAAAKGNTLVNYCGIGREFMDYVVDRSPHKQGLLLPGSRLPIHDTAHVFETKPDYVLILAWNWADEIIAAMAGIRDWGGRFVLPIPKVTVVT